MHVLDRQLSWSEAGFGVSARRCVFPRIGQHSFATHISHTHTPRLVDSIRTRVQTQRGNDRKTPVQIAREMYREGRRNRACPSPPGPLPCFFLYSPQQPLSGGVRVFYRGFLPCIMRAFPANAVVFLGLEMTLRGFGYSDF